jgi:hypothetical protein
MADLPAEGRRITIVGKGGDGKSTTAGHLLAWWERLGIPAAGLDADTPGPGEFGSLYTWSDTADLGAPVYVAPAASRLVAEARQRTPDKGLLAIDTGAWERKADNSHLAALAAADLLVLAVQPTPMSQERAGSILATIDQVEAMTGRAPRFAILLTMTNASAAAAREARADLVAAGFHVLETSVPRSDGRDGYGQAFGSPPRLVEGDAMHRLAVELHDLAADIR